MLRSLVGSEMCIRDRFKWFKPIVLLGGMKTNANGALLLEWKSGQALGYNLKKDESVEVLPESMNRDALIAQIRNRVAFANNSVPSPVHSVAGGYGSGPPAPLAYQ
eukprot:TRINITY_DN43146_c0_g1_i1.p1 TRINITY_DN43146_c0_g1~~TRINITY_DN43146_c0_g1_i1.p1  ORF type:complete len:106 (-),score=35.40 TRINITY_DN43146_c0_g1_i1:179-496(-)